MERPPGTSWLYETDGKTLLAVDGVAVSKAAAKKAKDLGYVVSDPPSKTEGGES